MTEYYLGRTLMPWQKHVLNIALEVDPETNLLVYRQVILTVPRQSGKSTLLLSLILHRCMSDFFGQGRQQCVYAAQTQKDARAKWLDDYLEEMNQSRRLKGAYQARLANGSESIRFTNGSRFSVTANTEKAGHGKTLDLAVIDEAFAQIDFRLDQAFRPTLSTRKQPQMWIVSTAGGMDSVYLKDKVELGRKAVADGVTEGVAYFEWSADDTADPGDPETWKTCMPALGHTVPQSAIQADFLSMPLVEFRRAYLNQWVDRNAGEQVLPAEQWDACYDPDAVGAGRYVAGIDISPDRGYGAVAVAGYTEDDQMLLHVTDRHEGINWVVEAVARLHESGKCDGVVIDRAGPAASLIPDLQARGIEPIVIGTSELGRASASLYDAVLNGEVRHHKQPPLEEAISGARKRDIGDGVWAFGRKVSHVDISPLVAVALAYWGGKTSLEANYDLMNSFLVF